MSHESHNNSQENPFSVPFRSAFWLVIILVGLFIAGLNFIAAEKGGEGEKKETTEMKAGGNEGEKAESAEPKKAEAEKAEEKKETKEGEAKEEAGH